MFKITPREKRMILARRGRATGEVEPYNLRRFKNAVQSSARKELSIFLPLEDQDLADIGLAAISAIAKIARVSPEDIVDSIQRHL